MPSFVVFSYTLVGFENNAKSRVHIGYIYIYDLF